MAKGDLIRVVLRVGDSTTSIVVSAEKQGRSVRSEWQKEGNIQWFIAQETTRGGTVVRELRSAAAEVISIETIQKEM